VAEYLMAFSMIQTSASTAAESFGFHLEVLTAAGFAYEVVPSRPPRTEKRREDTSR
jgi:hypothetical protein